MNNAPKQGVVKYCNDTKYNGGWHTNLTSGGLNTLKWKELPFRTGKSTIHFRYSSNGAASVCCQIGDTMTKSVNISFFLFVYSRDARGYADFSLIVTEGDISLNYAEIIAEK